MNETLRKTLDLLYQPMYARLLLAGLELDIFSRLKEATSAEEFAQKRGWHENNTKIMLDALVAIGYLQKQGDAYKNTEFSNQYLTRSSADFVGGFMMHYTQLNDFERTNIPKLVQNGPGKEQTQEIDFSYMEEAMKKIQTGYRQKEIVSLLKELPEYGTAKKLLDIGCGPGLMGIAAALNKPDLECVLFDQEYAGSLMRECIVNAGVETRVTAITGDFTKDPIGEGYDIVLAMGMMYFPTMLDEFMQKLYNAMSDRGVLICISEGVVDDIEPKDVIISWLPYAMKGLDMALPRGMVSNAALKNGFRSAHKQTRFMSCGTMDIDVIRK